MNQDDAYKKLNELSKEDLVLFRANLHADSVPMPIWESRMKIVQNLTGLVARIAKEKSFDIPSVGDLLKIQRDSYIDPNKNIIKYLSVSWEELEKSYFC